MTTRPITPKLPKNQIDFRDLTALVIYDILISIDRAENLSGHYYRIDPDIQKMSENELKQLSVIVASFLTKLLFDRKKEKGKITPDENNSFVQQAIDSAIEVYKYE